MKKNDKKSQESQKKTEEIFKSIICGMLWLDFKLYLLKKQGKIYKKSLTKER